MSKVVKEYFTQVFADSRAQNVHSQNSSTRLVSNEQNDKLMKELTFEEFSKVVYQMHPDKESGSDGLNPAFYQNFWNVMRMDVFEGCNGWLKGGAFPADLNYTNVVLIPKKEGACRMKDFRPTALCNVFYKVMAKVLANRLVDILPDLTSEHQ